MRYAVYGLILILTLAAWAAIPVSDDLAARVAAAERLVEEGSYRLALEQYQKIDTATLSAKDARWVLFRRADLLWRSAPEDRDDTPIQQAERELRAMLLDEKGAVIDDPVRPEILESLGDLYGSRRRHNDSQAWQFYQQALQWWGGSRDLDPARERYLRIVFKAAGTGEERWRPMGSFATNLPLDVIENAVKIARDPEDAARARYLLALHLAQRHDAETVERTRAAFEDAIAGPRDARWRDDALFQYAQWLTRSGRIELDEASTTFRIRPDWERAVEIFEILVRDYTTGQSRWREQAAQQLAAIREPSLVLAVSQVF
ncbi:MAG TPA: hypothetical protein VM534_07990, partial [Thermoanaerobaculia bacterium]|nr:hypothetical protein [Thermoanaerobaculia bacterium]